MLTVNSSGLTNLLYDCVLSKCREERTVEATEMVISRITREFIDTTGCRLVPGNLRFDWRHHMVKCVDPLEQSRQPPHNFYGRGLIDGPKCQQETGAVFNGCTANWSKQCHSMRHII